MSDKARVSPNDDEKNANIGRPCAFEPHMRANAHGLAFLDNSFDLIGCRVCNLNQVGGIGFGLSENEVDLLFQSSALQAAAVVVGNCFALDEVDVDNGKHLITRPEIWDIDFIFQKSDRLGAKQSCQELQVASIPCYRLIAFNAGYFPYFPTRSDSIGHLLANSAGTVRDRLPSFELYRKHLPTVLLGMRDLSRKKNDGDYSRGNCCPCSKRRYPFSKTVFVSAFGAKCFATKQKAAEDDNDGYSWNYPAPIVPMFPKVHNEVSQPFYAKNLSGVMLSLQGFTECARHVLVGRIAMGEVLLNSARSWEVR